jgi:hypothetical protein
MWKLLLNMNPSKTLALVKELLCFDDLIELDVMFTGSLHLGFHDPIENHLLNAIKIEFCTIQLLGHL